MKYLLLSLLFVLALSADAQKYHELEAENQLKFSRIQDTMEAFYQVNGTQKGTGYNPYKRWEYWSKRALSADGMIIPQGEAYARAKKFRDRYGEQSRAVTGNYIDLGPSSAVNTSTWSSHLGRVTGIGIDPSDPTHMIVSSPGGGVWKTTNTGNSWTPLYDTEDLLNVYSADISPGNSQLYLIGTSGRGIRKSTDGGVSWTSSTGESDSDTYSRFLFNPENPNTVLAIGQYFNRVYLSTDAGSTWSIVHSHSGDMLDLEYMPGDTSVVYAGGYGAIMKSTDGGRSFTNLTGPWGSIGPIMVSTTAADDQCIYALQAINSSRGLQGVYRSLDAGTTWTTQIDSTGGNNNYLGYTQSQNSSQAPRDMDIAVSQSNINEVHIAGVETWKSTNAGTSFTQSTDWNLSSSLPFIHADVDLLIYKGDTLFAGTDGGLFYSIDAAVSWTDISEGMTVRQFYRIGVSKTDEDRVSGGSQDNGTGVLRDGVWYDWLGADGMETFIDWSNKDILYGTSQNGTLYKSLTGGNSRTSPAQAPGSGNWVTPLEQDPKTATTLYTGKRQVSKSIDSGASWDSISAFSPGSLVDEMKIVPDDPAIIYAAVNDTLWKTSDGGAIWIDASPTTVFSEINYITLHPTDTNRLAVALSGSTWKYAESLDGGSTWSNITSNLPNITAECILYEGNDVQGIFVGMRPGIYYRDSTTSTWSSLQLNLPNVTVTELQIEHNHLYVGTYGRGLFKIELNNVIGFNCESPFLGSSECSVSITAPAIDQGDGSSQPDATKSIWYSYTADSDEVISIRSCDSDVNTRLFVHDGTCGSLTLLASGDDDCYAGPVTGDVAASISGLALTDGQKILIEWDNRWSESGFDWKIEQEERNCEKAGILLAAGTHTALGPERCNGALNAEADHASWYEFIPPTNGSITIASCGGGVDTRLWVYKGICGNLTSVANSDDDCEMSTGSDLWATSISGIAVLQGQSIFIEWDNRWSTSGFDFTIAYDSTDPCPPDHDDANSNQLTGYQNNGADFESDGYIDSEQLVLSGASVIYDSGLSVELLNGFEVQVGAELTVFIDGCGNLIVEEEESEEK